jgi:hypothetical protein
MFCKKNKRYSTGTSPNLKNLFALKVVNKTPFSLFFFLHSNFGEIDVLGALYSLGHARKPLPVLRGGGGYLLSPSRA